MSAGGQQTRATTVRKDYPEHPCERGLGRRKPEADAAVGERPHSGRVPDR